MARKKAPKGKRSPAEVAVKAASQLDSRTLLNIAKESGVLPTSDVQDIAPPQGSTLVKAKAKLGKASFVLQVARPAELTEEQKKQVLALLESNMRALYEKSSQGWDAKEKVRELFAKESRFILLHTASETAMDVDGAASPAQSEALAGYLLWRFDTEECMDEDPCARKGQDEVEVAYCYELQLSASTRGQGVGKTLMRIQEAIARHTKMRKVMLTAFLHNDEALSFYKSLGYTPDGISPSQLQDSDDETDRACSDDDEGFEDESDDDEVEDYEIMSKSTM